MVKSVLFNLTLTLYNSLIFYNFGSTLWHRLDHFPNIRQVLL